jgi:hypothetical protein
METTSTDSVILAGVTINAPSSQVVQVQDAYIAYYGRPADIDGLKYWAEKLQAEGGDINGLVTSFGNSTESQTLYGNLDATQLINNIYQQVLGRSADQGGLDFYLNVLTSKSAAFIALDIYNGAKNADPATTDTELVKNKLSVAMTFTGELDTASEKAAYAGDVNAQLARDMLSTVTATTDSTSFDTNTTLTAMIANNNTTPTVSSDENGVTIALSGIDHSALDIYTVDFTL